MTKQTSLDIFEFVLNKDNNTYSVKLSEKISGTDPKIPKEIVIPGRYNGKKVTAVANEGFIDSQMKRVVLPDNIHVIGSSAFEGCTQLETIKLPEKLRRIEYCAFFFCSSLKYINIPDSVNYIGHAAFKACEKLKELYIGRGVREIHGSTFSENDSLRHIHIPGNVKYIGHGAFRSCKKLKTITMDEGVEFVEEIAFADNPNLESVIIPKSVYCMGTAVLSNCDKLKNVELKGGMTCLPFSFVVSSKELEHITVPEGTVILHYCALSVGSLKSVDLPGSLRYIGHRAFSYCKALERINFNGRLALWLSIEKKPDWNEECRRIIVKCTDGIAIE